MRIELQKISEAIQASQQIVIFTHVSVDGDCLGSSIALALALTSMNKQVHILSEAPVPGSLEFLPGKEFVVKQLPENFKPDLSISVDCGDKERFIDREAVYDSAEITANIDHHRTNIGFAKLNCVDKHRSSTAELVFELIKGLSAEVTAEIATCIYVGLVTDTGGFRFGNTNAETHMCAAELLGYGIDVASISEECFNYTTESILRLKVRALNSLQLEYEKRLAIVTVRETDFIECGADKSETEGFADFGRALSTVVASVCLREFEKNKIRVSMRSKGDYNVAKIATNFGGGGHINAAGCSIDDTLENAKARIIAAFEDLKNR